MTIEPPQPSRCPVCRSNQTLSEYSSASLAVDRCASCEHRFARHSPVVEASDYYEHTPQSVQFVSSLEFTRRRQARLILSRFARHGKTSDWLDFGCGRGWFLDEARSRASGAIAGFDSSALSRTWLRESGLLAAEPRTDDPFWPDWSSLPFSPRVVSFLDVIEHVAEGGAERLLRRLHEELPALEWIVLKVPASEGILYRTAHAIRNAFPGPYQQLHQVGTSPPHHHYFSQRSLRTLIVNAGYVVVDLMLDHDVDNVFHRSGSLARLPGGALLTRLIRLGPADSVIMFARVGQHAKAGGPGSATPPT
ncbi:MAG TPA: class I SAM-dependent methyltransferase [Polyangiaceae bacterium]|nr:class I SAM-dependent methyltransferase [Polyangiaceae bacterium]